MDSAENSPSKEGKYHGLIKRDRYKREKSLLSVNREDVKDTVNLELERKFNLEKEKQILKDYTNHMSHISNKFDENLGRLEEETEKLESKFASMKNLSQANYNLNQKRSAIIETNP